MTKKSLLLLSLLLFAMTKKSLLLLPSYCLL